MRLAFIVTTIALIGSDTIGSQGLGIQQIAWLEGCWELTSAGRTVEERWTSPKGGSMLGLSRTIRDGKLTEYELIVLREDGDRLAYIAHPSGQKPATFLSTRVGPAEVVFENPAHDFPKQIAYRLAGNALTASVSAGTRRIEFPYQRVKCDR